MNKIIKMILMIAVMFIWSGMVMAKDKAVPKTTTAGEQIKWQVISDGGAKGTSTNYKLEGTIGQTASAKGISSSYNVNHGYWQNFGTSGCCVRGGDANHDGKLNLLDAAYIINKLYRGGPDFICRAEADAEANGTINLRDVAYIINGLYRAGPMPTCP